MSKKVKLLALFGEYKVKYNDFQTKLILLDESADFTPQGKEEAKRKLVEGFQPTITLYHDMIVEIINKGLEALENKWKKASVGKLTDGGYQAGLANVIKMLELGAIKQTDDIQNIIEAYKEDFNALAMIKKVLQSSSDGKISECCAMIPEDNRGKNKELLEKLRGNVEMYINVKALSTVSKAWNSFNSITTDVALGMDSMSDFVTNKLGDDLELLS